MNRKYINPYKLPLLSSIFNQPNTYLILLHERKLKYPIHTDMENVLEFHYILRDMKYIHKVPYGERRYPSGPTFGFLESYTDANIINNNMIKRELPRRIINELSQYLEKKIHCTQNNLNTYNELLYKIK